MAYITSNLRLKELVLIAETNYNFYRTFVDHLAKRGYGSVYEFIVEQDSLAGYEALRSYLQVPLPNEIALMDGIGNPYAQSKGKWLLLGWLLRDAPEQRLRPMIATAEGVNAIEKQAWLLNEIRKDIRDVYPHSQYWEWPVIREVFIDRLEGSRRAKKGTLFETIVRRNLRTLFEQYALRLSIPDSERRLGGETYDVVVEGKKGTILLPVKTRETMGGGHAQLFTRDIHKSILVAEKAGYTCIPVIIAESWGGDLASLECEEHIYLKLNPNQAGEVETALVEQLVRLVPTFKRFA